MELRFLSATCERRPDGGKVATHGRRHSAAVFVALSVGWASASPIGAQDLPPVRINEVIADNGSVEPLDIGLGTPDMVELHNGSEEEVVLGTGSNPSSWYLGDEETFDPMLAWRFPPGTVLAPGSFLTIFCDNNILQAECELHAAFRIASNGTEPVSLWGPEDEDGERPLVDQVWLPPLREDVSFGRFPDGAGPAPVPVDETFDHFVFHPKITPAEESESPPTFGSCVRSPSQTDLCAQLGGENRECVGAENGEGALQQAPRVDRVAHTTNAPADGEEVTFQVRVRDDAVPTPENIEAVELRYRVDGGEVQTVEMVYDETGVLDGSGRTPPRPLDLWTLWTGTVPGQPAGARVEFHFYVRDTSGLESTSPRDLCDDVCPECTGPCDREFGGPDCRRDENDVTCTGDDDEPTDEEGDGGGAGAVVGERYIACDTWFTYLSGYEPSGGLESIVVNEVVASQDGLHTDATEPDCNAGDLCPDEDPDCCKKREDFVEILNTGDEPVDLSGLWVADSFFRPREWQFPPGSVVAPGSRITVWCDNDGGMCPDPLRPDPPCFWECPDPTDPDLGRYHTNFALDLQDDQFYLFDTEENGFGLVHGVAWDRGTGLLPVDVNQSIALLPDGSREGCYEVVETPTPEEPNVGECSSGVVSFRRGDASGNCAVDLTDAIFTLNWLFLGEQAPACQDAADTDDSGGIELTDAIFLLNWLFTGGETPPDPGPEEPGPDPTPDELPPCVYDCT